MQFTQKGSNDRKNVFFEYLSELVCFKVMMQTWGCVLVF